MEQQFPDEAYQTNGLTEVIDTIREYGGDFDSELNKLMDDDAGAAAEADAEPAAQAGESAAEEAEAGEAAAAEPAAQAGGQCMCHDQPPEQADQDQPAEEGQPKKKHLNLKSKSNFFDVVLPGIDEFMQTQGEDLDAALDALIAESAAAAGTDAEGEPQD